MHQDVTVERKHDLASMTKGRFRTLHTPKDATVDAPSPAWTMSLKNSIGSAPSFGASGLIMVAHAPNFANDSRLSFR
jgi:hypothetical protein